MLLASLTASPPPPAAGRSALLRGLCVGRRVIARPRRASCVRSLLSRGTLRRAPRSRPPSAVCRHSLRSGALRYRSAGAAARAAPLLAASPSLRVGGLCRLLADGAATAALVRSGVPALAPLRGYFLYMVGPTIEQQKTAPVEVWALLVQIFTRSLQCLILFR